MRCSDKTGVAKESGKFPCAICSKGVGSNSVIQFVVLSVRCGCIRSAVE